MDALSLFEENKRLLEKRLECVKAKISARAKLAKAKTNLESIKYMVSRELDKEDVSKTALKEMIQGDKRVVDAKNELEDIRCEFSMNDEKVEHIQEIINNNKKMIDSITADKKYFGG